MTLSTRPSQNKKLEKKLEDEDSDYEPNVANCKSPPVTIAVQENDNLPDKGKDVLDCFEDIGVCHAPNTVPDGMQNIPPPPERFAVTNFNTNHDHKNLVSSSTFHLMQQIILPRLEVLVSDFIHPLMFFSFA
jgi:hypothetical protein